MSYSLYTQCEDCITQALAVLTALRERRTITAATVQELFRRRRTADIALQAAFEELRHAFITPAPREALWELRCAAACVTDRAEAVQLALYHCGRSALYADDTALLSAVKEECCRLLEAFAALPQYPKSEAVIKALTALEKQHRTAEQTTASAVAENALRHLSEACAEAARRLQYVLLTVS